MPMEDAPSVVICSLALFASVAETSTPPLLPPGLVSSPNPPELLAEMPAADWPFVCRNHVDGVASPPTVTVTPALLPPPSLSALPPMLDATIAFEKSPVIVIQPLAQVLPPQSGLTGPSVTATEPEVAPCPSLPLPPLPPKLRAAMPS